MVSVDSKDDEVSRAGGDLVDMKSSAGGGLWWPLGAPWFPVIAGLIIGIFLDERVPQRQWVYLVGLGVVALAAVCRQVRTHAATLLVFLAAGFLGGLSHLAAARSPSPDDVGRYARESGRIVRLQGVIASTPRIVARSSTPLSSGSDGEGRMVFLLDARALEGVTGLVHVDGRIRVTLLDPRLDLREQDRVELFGRLFPLFPPRNPGAFDWGAFHRRQGISATLRCEHRETVRILESDRRSLIQSVISWMRAKARALLVDDLADGSDEEADLLTALVLGQRSGLDRRINDVFIRSGCAHFLAASGTNVAIVLSPMWLLATWLRLGRKRRAVFLIAVIVAYGVVAEPRPPILRATVMAVAFLGSRLFGRSSNHANSLCIAASALLLTDPLSLFDLGFQLSFAAVVGVVYVAPAFARAASALRNEFDVRVRRRPMAMDDRRILRRVRTRGANPRQKLWLRVYFVRRGLRDAVAVSFAAWLVTQPIAAVIFQRVQWWGAACTLIVFPLVCVTTWLGIAKIVLTAASPTAGEWIGPLLVTLDKWVNGLVSALGDLPAASTAVPAPSIVFVLLFYSGILLFTFRWRRSNFHDETDPDLPRQTSSAEGWAFLRSTNWIAVALILGAFIPMCVPRRLNARLLVTVLSVGRGSATVLELPDGQTILYDAGGSVGWDPGRAAITPFLRHRSISSRHSAIISHPNVDHFSGLPSVLEVTPVESVILNSHFAPFAANHRPSRTLLEWLENHGQTVTQLDSNARVWTLAGVTFELLWPPDVLPAGVSFNDTSTVLRVSYAGKSILLTGDIEEFAQRKLLELGDLYADVLVLPHHGSLISTTQDFVRAVCPHAAIQSSSVRSQDNPDALNDALQGIPLYNTADTGAVQIRMDLSELQITSYLPGRREFE